ncbi:hydrolase activity protein [[Candida] boidinii]|nr:hydrolase activity protein [[Candida] boidinii]
MIRRNFYKINNYKKFLNKRFSSDAAATGTSITKYRHWETINEEANDSQDKDNKDNKFTVSSYNLLCRHYLWEQVYNYLPKKYTDWSYRLPLIDENLVDLNTDIMCFQEMEYKIYKLHWELLLNDKYDSKFIKKRKSNYWNKDEDMMDGVSIFYNKFKFELISCEYLDFAKIIDLNNNNLFDKTNDLIQRVLPRNTVGLLLILKDKRYKDKYIIITNTHLYWSPKFTDVKLIHTYLLKNSIKLNIKNLENNKNLKINEKNIGLLMCGDFNSNPYSSVYNYLNYNNNDKNLISKDEILKIFNNFNYGETTKFLQNELINDNLYDNFNLKSSYRLLYDKDKFNKTTYTNNFKDIIDYIWYSDLNLKLIKNLGSIDENYLSNFKGFPNKEFPSDHIPIISEFKWNE